MMRWYDRILSSLPIPYQSQWIATPYGKTHVLTAGSPYAPPLVMLHGINVNALNWKAQMVNLAPYFYVIAPDVPGYAGKSAAVRLAYRTNDFAHWLRAVLDAFGVENATIAGSSAGGYFALKFGAVYPQRTHHLILVNSCGICRYPYPLDFGRSQWVVNSVGKIGHQMATMERAERLVRMGVSAGVTPDPETVEMAYLLLKYFRRAAPPGPPSPVEFSRITAPTLLLLGEHEPYFNIHIMKREAERHLPNLHTRILSGGGHDIHNDRAEEVSAAILRCMMLIS